MDLNMTNEMQKVIFGFIGVILMHLFLAKKGM